MNNAVFVLLVFICPLIAVGQTDSSGFYYKKAVSEENNNQYQAAFGYFQQAVVFNAENADAQVGLGRTAVALKKFGIAAAALQKGLELKKKELGTTARFADLQVTQGQFDAAIAYARKAGVLKEDKNVQYIAGISYAETENGKPAGASGTNPDESSQAEIAYLIGRSLADKQNYRAAAPFLEQAVRQDTTNAQRTYECALNFSAIPDAKQAIKYYLLAEKRGYKPDDGYYTNLSNAYKAAGQTEAYEKIRQKIAGLETESGDN